MVHLEDERRYGLGVAAFEVGSGFARQEPLQRIARRPLAALVDTTGYGGHLAVLHGRDVLYVLEERAPGRPPLVTDVGVRLPAHLTASGRAILMALPSSQVRALYPDRAAFVDRLGTGPTSSSGLRTVLSEARQRGYADRGRRGLRRPRERGRPGARPQRTPGRRGRGHLPERHDSRRCCGRRTDNGGSRCRGGSADEREERSGRPLTLGEELVGRRRMILRSDHDYGVAKPHPRTPPDPGLLDLRLVCAKRVPNSDHTVNPWATGPTPRHPRASNKLAIRACRQPVPLVECATGGTPWNPSPRSTRRLGAAVLVALALVGTALALPDGTLARTGNLLATYDAAKTARLIEVAPTGTATITATPPPRTPSPAVVRCPLPPRTRPPPGRRGTRRRTSCANAAFETRG